MKVTGQPAAILNLMEKGFFFKTFWKGISASSMKSASRGRINGARNIAFEYYLTSSLPWIERGNCRQKSLCVRMGRRLEEGLFICHLNNFP
jgi:hypothetical protein